MNANLIKLNSWLEVNKIGLNIPKTEFMLMGSRQRLAANGNINLDVIVDNTRIKRDATSKSLASTVDENLF